MEWLVAITTCVGFKLFSVEPKTSQKSAKLRMPLTLYGDYNSAYSLKFFIFSPNKWSVSMWTAIMYSVANDKYTTISYSTIISACPVVTCVSKHFPINVYLTPCERNYIAIVCKKAAVI